MRTKQGIVAELRGGFGNQLFILAAAWAQAERLECPLYLDVSGLGNQNMRNYALGRLAHPGIIIRNNPTLAFFNRIVTRIGLRRVFREASFNYDPRIQEVKVGTRLEGYFQSPKYFQGMEQKIQALFQTVDLDEKERSYVESFLGKSSIHAHVRRGDYLLAHNQNTHGLASAAYFRRAKNLLDALHGPSVCQIFTDSPKIVSYEFRNVPEFQVVTSEDKELNEVVQILAMSNTRSFILSNSSFSWWAAWLLSQKSAATFICVAPRPWFVDGSSASDLLLGAWLTLDSREI